MYRTSCYVLGTSGSKIDPSTFYPDRDSNPHTPWPEQWTVPLASEGGHQMSYFSIYRNGFLKSIPYLLAVLAHVIRYLMGLKHKIRIYSFHFSNLNFLYPVSQVPLFGQKSFHQIPTSVVPQNPQIGAYFWEAYKYNIYVHL